ncbi:MAG: hypothetical protein IJX47_07625 [Clostridia bacterium]|nr:hypothetical protein [Clostridia bacterium]
MMQKIKKMTAMLLAGVLACTALVGCDEKTGGSYSGNTQQNSQYAGLSPTEIMEALGKAEDYVISSNATMSNNEVGINQSASMTVKKDGNYAIMEGSRMDGSHLSEYSTTYLDLGLQTGYLMDENGSWKREFDEDINWGTLLYWMAYDNDGGAVIEYILDDSNYYSTDTNKLVMREEGLARVIADGSGVSASGYMTSSGSTYTFVMTAQQQNTVLNFTVTIEFKSTSVTIPDSVRG